MPRRGVLNAPPRERVLSAGSLYGSASSTSGSAALGPKVRLWALVDEETNTGRLIAYRPDGTGLQRTDFGLIERMVVTRGARGKHQWTVTLASGEVITASAAPCVCGAGKVGHAGPVDGRHTIQTVRGSLLEWLET